MVAATFERQSASKIDVHDNAQFAEITEECKREALDGVPDMLQLAKAFVIAQASAAALPNLRTQLAVIMEENMSAAADFAPTFGEAFRSADEMVEQYLAGAKPHPAVTADDTHGAGYSVSIRHNVDSRPAQVLGQHRVKGL